LTSRAGSESAAAAYQAAAAGAGDAQGEEPSTDGFEALEGPDGEAAAPEGEETVEGEFKEV